MARTAAVKSAGVDPALLAPKALPSTCEDVKDDSSSLLVMSKPVRYVKAAGETATSPVMVECGMVAMPVFASIT
jgi:hypothetical protein